MDPLIHPRRHFLHVLGVFFYPRTARIAEVTSDTVYIWSNRQLNSRLMANHASLQTLKSGALLSSLTDVFLELTSKQFVAFHVSLY